MVIIGETVDSILIAKPTILTKSTWLIVTDEDMSINKVLKLAKAAIDKRDYEAALKHCQVSTYNL